MSAMTAWRGYIGGMWLLVMLAGCVPWPHQQQRSPALSGTLYQGDHEVAGAPVALQVNPDTDAQGCPAPAAVTETDGAGRFELPATSVKSWFIVFGDRWDVWRVCFDVPGAESAWDGGGWWGGPPSQVIECDLAVEHDAQVCAVEE